MGLTPSIRSQPVRVRVSSSAANLRASSSTTQPASQPGSNKASKVILYAATHPTHPIHHPRPSAPKHQTPQARVYVYYSANTASSHMRVIPLPCPVLMPCPGPGWLCLWCVVALVVRSDLSCFGKLGVCVDVVATHGGWLYDIRCCLGEGIRIVRI